MKDALQKLYEPFGEVLQITAHKNVRMRGQAFVCFAQAEDGSKALEATQDFPLYGSAMVGLLSPMLQSRIAHRKQKVSFAKTASDSAIKMRSASAFEAHLKDRLSRKGAADAQASLPN